MPCGQKNNRIEMIHSQIVTPPFAAIDGTTFRLKTATTKSSTRSQRPRTRLRCGGLADSVAPDKVAPQIEGGRGRPPHTTQPTQTLSAQPPPLSVPVALWPMPGRCLQTPQCACQCPLPCVERKLSTVRPTSTVAA